MMNHNLTRKNYIVISASSNISMQEGGKFSTLTKPKHTYRSLENEKERKEWLPGSHTNWYSICMKMINQTADSYKTIKSYMCVF